MQQPQIPSISSLVPLKYQREIVGYLKEAEPELWAWASSSETREEFAEQMRTDMLKANYRLDAEGHPELIARSQAVARALGVEAPITLYQATGGSGMNAMLCHLPGEAHIIFSGPILAALKGEELDAVIAHELAHYRLWDMAGGDFLVADRLLLAAADDHRASASQAQTARRFRLYTEIFADRGSLMGAGQLNAAVAALVKVETGLSEVSAASYLRQADEIFSKENPTTKGVAHPETFIRARALRLWTEGDADLDAWLVSAIEGVRSIDDLDLLGQVQCTRMTRRFLAQLLRPTWFQSASVLAHARAFFPDFSPASGPDETLVETLSMADTSTREYLCYLLLDFAVIDPELDDVPLAAAVDWSSRLGMAEQFEKLATKELGMGKKPWAKLKKDAASLLAKTEATL